MIVADDANLHTFADAIRFIGDHPGFLATKALEQLELSGAAIGIALLIALPLGIALGHFHRGSTLAIGASIFGRALPSLVLIAAFLTILGIGFVNNMVALAVLATGPILTNSFDGVDGVDRDAVEAARGMGMTRTQILRQVELPLSIPLLFTGVRVAAVTVVATAPIAAIAGGGGLGDVIVNQASYRLAGVLGASLCVMALSALVFVALLGLQIAVTPRGLRRTSVPGTSQKGAVVIRKHTRRAAKAAFAISLGVAIVIGLFAAAFARPAHSAQPAVILGTKNFPEEYILGQLYKQALESKGFAVTYKENIGSTEIIHGALEKGKITMYPEYTGVIVQVVYHHALSAKTAAATVTLAPPARGEEGDQGPECDTLLRYRRDRGAEDDGVQVPPEDAVRPEQDSRPQARSATGVPDAQYGTGRIAQELQAEGRDIRAVRRHLAVRRARCGQGPGGCGVLDRPPCSARGRSTCCWPTPLHQFGFQNVVPLVKASLFSALGPTFTARVNAVSRLLTTNAIIAMNKAVIINKQSPAKVAKAFLKANGLVK